MVVSAHRRIAALTAANLDDIDSRCRSCVYWELGPSDGARVERSGDPAAEKKAWVSNRIETDGRCGHVLYRGRHAIGFCLYAPPSAVPRARGMPTGPVSADAVLLLGGRVDESERHGGFGKLLVQSVAKDWFRDDRIRAIEVFGDSRSVPSRCHWPTDFLTAVGFEVVRTHEVHPRLRMDLRSAIAWRTELDVALERLLGAVRPDVPPSPAWN